MLCWAIVAVHAIFTANPGLGLAVDLCGYCTGVNYLGIQQTAKFDRYWSLFNSVFWRFFVLLIVRLLMLDGSE